MGNELQSDGPATVQACQPVPGMTTEADDRQIADVVMMPRQRLEDNVRTSIEGLYHGTSLRMILCRCQSRVRKRFHRSTTTFILGLAAISFVVVTPQYRHSWMLCGLQVRKDTSLLVALELFMSRRVSSLPVVDNCGRFVNVFSKADVMVITRHICENRSAVRV